MRRLLAVMLLVAISSMARAESFDEPVRKMILDLGPSPDQPDNPNLHRHLSCYYFPRFMVKQLDDDGNKGALRISITRLGSSHVACTRASRRGEIVISDGWDYYWGVKSGLVILIGADGSSGGINFDIFDARNGRKIFKDHVLTSESKDELNFAHRVSEGLSVTYQRVVYAGCSVLQDGDACWRQIRHRTGLKDAPVPKCDYSIAKDAPDDPSVISYTVQVDLLPRPTTRTLSQDAKCWAAE